MHIHTMQPALMLSLECLCLEKNMSGTYNIGMTFSDLYIQILEKEGAAMGEKDIAEAGFIALKDVFADIFNVLIYKGRRVVQEDELIELSRTTQYKSDDDELHEQERDVIKKWCGKGTLSCNYNCFIFRREEAMELFVASY